MLCRHCQVKHWCVINIVSFTDLKGRTIWAPVKKVHCQTEYRNPEIQSQISAACHVILFVIRSCWSKWILFRSCRQRMDIYCPMTSRQVVQLTTVFINSTDSKNPNKLTLVFKYLSTNKLVWSET